MNARLPASPIALVLFLACASSSPRASYGPGPVPGSPAPSASALASAPALAPALAPAPAPPRRPGAYANLDPDDDLILGPPDPYADCESELTAAGVKFKSASLPVHLAAPSHAARTTRTCSLTC